MISPGAGVEVDAPLQLLEKLEGSGEDEVKDPDEHDLRYEREREKERDGEKGGKKN